MPLIPDRDRVRAEGRRLRQCPCERAVNDMGVSARWPLLATLLAAVLVALLAPAIAHRRLDQDFEFDDAPEAPITHARRPRRYVYDPENPMCRALVCKKREVCLLRDAFTALCASKKDVLRRGDQIVSDVASDDEDVFYESHDHAASLAGGSPGAASSTGGARCVGCGSAARAAFLCGSDNRTYSSLCRLDLHNCVHRAAPPVRLACRGFCPCAPRGQRPERPQRPRRPDRPLRVRAHRRTQYDDERRRRRLDAHNEVFERPFRRPSQDMEGCALDKMANRLLDWFSVLMDEAGGIPPPQEGFPSGCKPEVRWMFSHLDVGGDGLLSPNDLYALRHDERERCLRPFLSSCAGGGGAGSGVSRGAWCGCLARAARPCAALARAHPAPPPGAYVPACDARGWYRPRQCHGALGVCWCVDAHGVERAGSRTKGKPQCPAGENDTENDVSMEDSSEVEGESETDTRVGREGAGRGAPDDDEDAGGSGDRNNELRF